MTGAVTIAGRSSRYNSPPASGPNPFSFVDQNGAALSTVTTSAGVTITGSGGPWTITVSGGTYDINASGTFVSTPGSITAGDSVRARVTSSGSYSTAVNELVTIGAQSDTFSVTTQASPGVLFFDDFASGDLSKTMNGFSWDGIFDGSVISGFSPQGNTGHCVRMSFATQFSAAQLGFLTGGNYQEMWFRWYQYMPDGTESPTRGPLMAGSSINGNKFLRVFALPQSNYPRYGASWYTTTGSNVGVGPQAGIFPGTGTVSQIGSVFEFCNAANRGRWVKMEWHGKNSTSAVSPNGVEQFWVDDVLVSNNTGLDSYEVGNTGFNNGYLMGSVDTTWNNPGTYTYIGDFAASITGRA